MTPVAGRRGSRSESQPARPPSGAVVGHSPPSARAVVARPASRTRSARDWIALVVGLAAGFLLGHLVLAGLWHGRTGIGVEEVVFGAAGAVAAAWLLRRRQAKPLQQAPAIPVTPPRPSPVRLTDLEQGVQDIRRTDRGFDAARFAGYAAMTFRDLQHAQMARDAGGLRDRLVPAMYIELEARCDQLRARGRSARFAAVEVSAEVTEAWQDGTRDYVTAYVAGSMLSHTVDDATGEAVEGSPATPTPVEAFLTFTRPAGLNFWMLSLVQGEAGIGGRR